MKNSIKGALLSGLVFPGLGQMILRRYGRGISFILIVTCGLAVFFVIALQRAFAIINKLLAEGGMIDINTISKAATQATSSSDNLIMTFCLLLILICWIISTFDAYRIGRKIDIQKSKSI